MCKILLTHFFLIYNKYLAVEESINKDNLIHIFHELVPKPKILIF